MNKNTHKDNKNSGDDNNYTISYVSGTLTITKATPVVTWNNPSAITYGTALGGELLVPKIPSYRITDVAEAIGPGCKKPVVGIRPGEKIHEEMITASDSFSTVDLGPYYAILPSDGITLAAYRAAGIQVPAVPQGFAYNSGTNPNFLSVEQLRSLIREHVNPTFHPL